MTRTEKEQEIRNKVLHLEHLSDVLIDVVLELLKDGGDAK